MIPNKIVIKIFDDFRKKIMYLTRGERRPLDNFTKTLAISQLVA